LLGSRDQKSVDGEKRRPIKNTEAREVTDEKENVLMIGRGKRLEKIQTNPSGV